MTERRDYSEIKQAAEDGARDGVKLEINGSIIELSRKFDAHIADHKVFQDEDRIWKKGVSKMMEELKPVQQGLETIDSIKGFSTYWAGVITPLGIILAAFYAIIRYIR